MNPLNSVIDQHRLLSLCTAKMLMSRSAYFATVANVENGFIYRSSSFSLSLTETHTCTPYN